MEYINAKAQDCVDRGVPVISVDTKKELVGSFKNGGREWQPKGDPDLVDVHNFPSDAVGKAIPSATSVPLGRHAPTLAVLGHPRISRTGGGLRVQTRGSTWSCWPSRYTSFFNERGFRTT